MDFGKFIGIFKIAKKNYKFCPRKIVPLKKISFDRFNNKDNKFIDINLKQENLIKELHKVDFIIDNPVSPLSLLESSDGRELGILLESIKINHLN